FISLKQYIFVRARLIRQLEAIISSCQIVQADYGGHPLPLGMVVWPVAQRMGRKCIWVFYGADPVPLMVLHANNQKNHLKKLVQRILIKRYEAFFRTAIRQADAVFAHNTSVSVRYKDVWHERCFLFERSFVTRDILIDEAEFVRRQRSLLD